MFPAQSILVLAAAAAVVCTSDTMGPASFMWPPDRAWSATTDNTAPCGSSQGVGNRTAFPLTGGRVAFTAQDDSYNAELRISFNSDPKTQGDFDRILNKTPIPEVDPGHTCISIPDLAPVFGFGPGTNATIQIKYTADFDHPENQTFYACADVTYVAATDFNRANIPCFNATTDEDVPAPTATGIPTGLPGHGDSGPPLDTPQPDSNSSAAGPGGISNGGIAGAVVGSVVGFALIAGLGLLFYRERERKKRLVRQRDSALARKWGDGSQAGKDSASGVSIRMENLA